MKITIPKNNTTDQKPTNYYWVVDLSGSMYGAVRQLRETLKSVKELLSPKDTFSLAYFSSFGDFNWICKGSKISEKGLNKIIEDNIFTRGLTCFNQVLESLETVVKDVSTMSESDENVLFFLTDGYPNDRSPEHQVLSVSSKLKNVFTQKRIVGYSSYYNRRLLLDMAENMGGVFNHISDFTEMQSTATNMVSNKKSFIKIKLPTSYDLVWQVSDGEIFPVEVQNGIASALASANSSELYAVDYKELNALPKEQLDSPSFVYSLAYILSQKNKANLGVAVLRSAGDYNSAKTLQKAFTVLQKGQAENKIKALAFSESEIPKTSASSAVSLESFVKHIKNNFGKISIDMKNSNYKSISRKGNDLGVVKFELTDEKAKIVGITGNENRANISFLTARKGKITEILDETLREKVAEYNKKSKTPIILPIDSETYRNYAFVANGDFNFDKFTVEDTSSNPLPASFIPSEYVDLFDENVKEIKISEFTNLYKTLIAEKAYASVLRMYIKANAEQKHLEDKRVDLYDNEAAGLLAEMGLDYAMRFSPKAEHKAKDENADFIPFLEMTAQIKGSAAISASKSYEKYKAKGKANPGDDICWPHFKVLDEKLVKLGKETFVEFCQKTLEGVEETVDLLSRKVSSLKFFLMITNSWFSDIEKSDKFEYDGMVIQTKEVNEYL